MSKQIHKIISIFCLILSLSILCNIQTGKADEPLSVEGVWEIISSNFEILRKDIGQRQSISRRGDGYEVKWLDGRSTIPYTGNEKRIVQTFHEDLGASLSTDAPASVLQQIKGKKVPINISYTLSADGNFLQMACDYIQLYYGRDTGRFDHYEIESGRIQTTLKRVSEPPKTTVKNPLTSAVGQVESRGEFYVLTKDGRKLTGKDADQIPLEEGTKVITGKDGHIKMTLPDNTTFTIGPDSDIVIDTFVYDPDNTPKTIIASVSKGAFRWVTGKVMADRSVHQESGQMKVNLPVVAVGIRGTDFEATVASDGSGSVVLNFGQLEITENKTGFTFILDAGQKVIFGADGSISRPIKF